MSFKFDANNIIQGLANLENRTKAAISLYGDTVTKKMEAYAKTNRPWTDRSSSAKNRLTGTSVRLSGNTVRCTISHGVEYGIWLELCNEGKYAIIKKTVDAISPEALKGLNNLLK